MAASQSSTIANDGDQNVNEPSTASTPANGSAAPTKPVPMSRQPYAALRQSSVKPDSGSSPPPPTPPEPMSQENSPTDAAAVPSSTQRAARADELQLVRSTARSRPSRFRGGLAASARLVGLQPQRRDRRPADGARRLQDAPGAGDPHAGEHGGQRRGELARDGARLLDEEEAHRAQHGEREVAHPVEGHRQGGRVREPAMQGSGPCRAGVPPSRPRPAVAERAGHAVGGESHPRRGHDRDAVAGEAGAHAEVERVVDRRERRVEPLERLPDRVPHEHGRRVQAQHVAQPVVLPLVELVGDDRHAPPEAGDRAAEDADAVGLLPLHELRTGDGDGLRGLERGEQGLERVGLRRGVLGEQPQRVGVGAGRVEHPLPARTASPNESGSWSSTTWVAPAAAACSRAAASACASTTTSASGVRTCARIASRVRRRWSPP